MRRQVFVAVPCSYALVFASASILFAGVVMAERSTATGPDGRTNSQVKTIYLQGNKQKVERQDVAAITDLDKSVVYIIDKQHHDYAEIPLQKVTPSLPGNERGRSIKLDRTGEVRVIANQPCREYRASEADKLERVTISACVSTNAPGARELSEFDRKMIVRLSGRDLHALPDGQADALMLEKRSTVRFRVPDPSQRRPYRTASLSAKTRIDQIQLRQLPPETFRPPKNYNQLRTRRPEAAPPMSPVTTGQTIEVIARGWSHGTWSTEP
jgi:hypothetical protein